MTSEAEATEPADETVEAPAPTPATPARPPRSLRRIDLTPKQWAEIEELWQAGAINYADLVKKYGKSVSTFERHFRKRKLIKGSKIEAIRKKVAAEVERNEINDATVLAARIKETKDEHYKMAAALSRLTWAEVLEAKKNARPMATALNNLKALDAAATVLKKTREERFAVLGLDRTDAIDPDAIPELVISELTPEQVKALRERDHTEAEDAPVVQDPAANPSPPEELDDDPDDIVEESE